METQKTPNSQKAILRKKNGAGGIRLFYFRLYYKATFIKIVFTHTHTHTRARTQRNISQWNRIESPEIKPNTSGQLVYDKGGKTIQ